MKNGDIRSSARMDMMQHTKEIMQTVLLWVLTSALLNWVAQQISSIWGGQQLWDTIGSGLIDLALAPLGLGVVEQLLGLERDQAPQAKKALEWFQQSPRRNRAWTLGLLLFLLWLALQGVSRLGYWAVAGLFGRGQSVSALLALEQQMQPRMFVLGCLAVDYLTGLVQMLGYLAVVLLANHPDWSPAQCLGHMMQMVRLQPGRCFGMAAVVSLQSALVFLVGILLSIFISLIGVALIAVLLSGPVGELMQLAFSGAIFISVTLLIVAYCLLCLIGLTRELEEQHGI